MNKDGNHNTTAVIVAAGSGRRMGSRIAKQYIPLSEIPILVRAVIPFEKARSVNKIVLVVPAGDRNYVRRNIVQQWSFKKVVHIAAGGEKRQDSVMNALRLIDETTEIVVIHDGVRPFIESKQIDTVIREAQVYGAAAMGIPVADTVKKSNDDNVVIHTVDRTMLWLAQTPQAFRREIILPAYAQAGEDAFYGTDDASLVERMGIAVRMVHGTPHNIKITTREDLAFARKLVTGQKTKPPI